MKKIFLGILFILTTVSANAQAPSGFNPNVIKLESEERNITSTQEASQQILKNIDTIKINGVVRNISDKTVGKVTGHYTFFDETGRPIATQDVFVSDSMYPGQFKEFSFQKDIQSSNQAYRHESQFSWEIN